MFSLTNNFNHEFDIDERGFEEVFIKETIDKKNCYVWDKEVDSKSYSKFVICKNTASKTVCSISFFKSNEKEIYIPRLTFERLSLDNELKESRSDKKVSIRFDSSEKAINFWRLISFLKSYKDLVDTDSFAGVYNVKSKEQHLFEVESEEQKVLLSKIGELLNNNKLNENELISILKENRKTKLRGFLMLLRNENYMDENSFVFYRKKYGLPPGQEAVWHHFLKTNDWILGLNVDIKFINKFFHEQKVGIEDSQGKGSPKTDLLGISHYTTLIELKHAQTNIFKIKELKDPKGKARANTWEFTPDFIEGISQCLGQKFSLDKSYDNKRIYDEKGVVLSKEITKTLDPKSIFIIGDRKREFPHDSNIINHTKSETFERFRRNLRNVEIITFDELFERAYHILYSEKIVDDWYTNSDFLK